MKKYLSNFMTAAKNWELVSGYSNRKIVHQAGDYSLVVVEYEVAVGSVLGLNGKNLVFFSDMHFGSYAFHADVFQKILKEIKPSWAVFGGDLITYACYQDPAFSFLEKVFEPFPDTDKVAVYGNWDRRRVRWYPSSKWLDAYSDIGFHLLINENIELGGINFYGMDEPRIGSPEFNVKLLDVEKLNCIVSHSVDPVVDAMPNNNFDGKQLMLCGHSHGGQVRIPFFGAFLTSTKYWKLFEYGHYYFSGKDIDLIMTSGLGTTRLPFRIFCQPEIVVIKFIEENGK